MRKRGTLTTSVQPVTGSKPRPGPQLSRLCLAGSAVCALWNFGLAGWCLYPLARGCRAPRRMTPELAATAPAIPVWRYRLVAGAAELGGSVADRGACNNAVSRVTLLLRVSSCARGRRRGQRFRSGGAGAQLWDCSARADRIRWPRGGCGGCALWHFRPADRRLIGRRAVAERRAANSWSPWSPMLADGEARRCFLFGTWRSAVAELVGNSRSQQLAAGRPSDVLALCWILASAERDRS